MTSTVIRGTGFVVGEHCVTNAMLGKITDAPHEWIVERSGIEQRYYVEEGVAASDLAVGAANKALQDAGLTKGEIDYIVFATMTPDYYFPGCGSLLQHKLGMGDVPALDIRQQCAGFIYGLQAADGLIKAGAGRNILFVASEVHSGFTPWTPQMIDYMLGRTQVRPPQEDIDAGSEYRDRTILFGDAAGAVVLSAAEAPGLLGVKVHSNGAKAESLYIPAAGSRYRPFVSEDHLREDRHIPVMAGRVVFKVAVEKVTSAVREVCEASGVSVNDIDVLIGHQANLRVNEAVQRMLGIEEGRSYNNIARYGNTGAATIPIGLDECRKSGRIKAGQLVCFAAFGAGFLWGAALYRA
jgi:3-oxoacyl-[acyl-carrier-protein] synthase-3